MCASAGITSVVLFGSTARGTASRHSDVDLAIAPCGPFEFAHLPHLQSDLAQLLGRPVQLEPYALLPLYYQIDVDQDGIVLNDLAGRSSEKDYR